MSVEDDEKSVILGSVLSVWHSAVVNEDFKSKIAEYLEVKIGFLHPINRYRIHLETNAIAAGCVLNKLGHVLLYDDIAFNAYLRYIAMRVNIPYAKISDFDFHYTKRIFMYAKSLSGIMYFDACDLLCSALLGNKATEVPFMQKTLITMEIMQVYSLLDEAFKDSEYK